MPFYAITSKKNSKKREERKGGRQMIKVVIIIFALLTGMFAVLQIGGEKYEQIPAAISYGVTLVCLTSVILMYLI